MYYSAFVMYINLNIPAIIVNSYANMCSAFRIELY